MASGFLLQVQKAMCSGTISFLLSAGLADRASRVIDEISENRELVLIVGMAGLPVVVLVAITTLDGSRIERTVVAVFRSDRLCKQRNVDTAVVKLGKRRIGCTGFRNGRVNGRCGMTGAW